MKSSKVRSSLLSHTMLPLVFPLPLFLVCVQVLFQEKSGNQKLIAKDYHAQKRFLFKVPEHGIIDFADADIEHWWNRRLVFICRRYQAHRIPAVLICQKYIKIIAKMS